jgi:ribosomal protein L7/L12
MRQVIIDLVECINGVSDTRSKKELATIVRRELEIDLQDAGVTSDNTRVTQREVSLANNGKKLEAVKLYKKRTGASLIDAKHAVEAAMSGRRMADPKNSDYRYVYNDVEAQDAGLKSF